MTPYEQGAHDYWHYCSRNDCPYDSEKSASVDWEDGYLDARALDNSDIEYYNDHLAAEWRYK